MSLDNSEKVNSITPWLAKFHCYQAVAPVLIMPPLYFFAAASALQITCLILDRFLMEGYAFVTLLVTALLILAGYALIARLADPLEKEEAFARNEIKLPIIALGIGTSLSKFFLAPTAGLLGLKLTGQTSLHMASVFQIATAAFLVGVMAAMPLLGPKSILRASIIPLVSNPTVSKARWLRNNPLAIFSPDPHGFSQYPDVGRRFQSPKLSTILSQVIIAIALGCLVYWTLTWGVGDRSYQTSLIIVILGAALYPFFTFAFECEIDPRPYLTSPTGVSRPKVASVAVQAVPRALGMTALAIAMTTVADNFPGHFACLHILLTSFGLHYYRTIVQEMIISAILTPNNVRALMFSFDVSMDAGYITEIILDTIIPRKDIVRQVIETSNDRSEPRALNEMRWVNRMAFELKVALISRTQNEVDNLLEGDAFGILLLDHLGGLYSNSDASILKDFVDYVYNRESNYPTPWVVPLIRGLSLYCNSIGQALQYIQSKEARSQRRADVWSLPPAFVMTMDCTIRAITTCITRNIDDQGRSMENYRTSHVLFLVPTALEALYTLQQGLRAFLMDKGTRISVLVALCEASCIDLFDCLERNKQVLACPLNPIVQEWVMRCQSSREA